MFPIGASSFFFISTSTRGDTCWWAQAHLLAHRVGVPYKLMWQLESSNTQNLLVTTEMVALNHDQNWSYEFLCSVHSMGKRSAAVYAIIYSLFKRHSQIMHSLSSTQGVGSVYHESWCMNSIKPLKKEGQHKQLSTNPPCIFELRALVKGGRRWRRIRRTN
jgi:hypothetical protein